MRWPFILLSAALLTTACTPPEGYSEYKYLQKTGNRAPSPQRFTLCSGYGCRTPHNTGFTASEWNTIRTLFAKPAATPRIEREQVRVAIGRMEMLMGARTGTAGDKGDTFAASSGPDQMDCEDEAYNTSTYLQLLADAGLLHHHSPAQRLTRGHLIDRWPHITASLRETKSGAVWVVDSWFFDNGVPPVIIPAVVWQGGWSPGPNFAFTPYKEPAVSAPAEVKVKKKKKKAGQKK